MLQEGSPRLEDIAGVELVMQRPSSSAFCIMCMERAGRGHADDHQPGYSVQGRHHRCQALIYRDPILKFICGFYSSPSRRCGPDVLYLPALSYTFDLQNKPGRLQASHLPMHQTS
jgi:hypothetical protein